MGAARQPSADAGGDAERLADVADDRARAGLGGPVDEAALPLGARLALAEIAELREQLAETTAKLRRAEEKLDGEMKKVA